MYINFKSIMTLIIILFIIIFNLNDSPNEMGNKKVIRKEPLVEITFLKENCFKNCLNNYYSIETSEYYFSKCKYKIECYQNIVFHCLNNC
jgi:hypothetical protein